MDDADWATFAALVPAGSQAKFRSDFWLGWAEGVILENRPFSLIDRDSKSVFLQDALRYQWFGGRDDAFEGHSTHMEVERMLYLVGDEWLTFIQVMCRSGNVEHMV